MRYVRFVVHDRNWSSAFRTGVFHAADELLWSGELSESESAHLEETRSWFNTNLESPDRFSRKRNASHKRHRGISWFKDSATEHIQRIRSLASLLEEHGVLVEMLTTARPGFVVYEDEHQVVAEPFADTET